jgi:hypothetical protein
VWERSQKNADNQLQFVNLKLAEQCADYATRIADTYRTA